MVKRKHMNREDLKESVTNLKCINLELQNLVLGNPGQDEIIESLKGQVDRFDRLLILLTSCVSEEGYAEARRLSFKSLCQTKMGTDIIIGILSIKESKSLALSKAREYHNELEHVVSNLMLDYRGTV